MSAYAEVGARSAVVTPPRWVLPVLVLAGSLGAADPEPAAGRSVVGAEQGLPLEAVLELETTARLLVLLFDSGRAVINEHQELFDDPTKGDKGFTPALFERQVTDMFLSRASLDLRELPSVRLPARTKELLRTLLDVGRQVVGEAQADINRRDVGFKGFIPAVFGARVAGRFAERTGVRLKQTSLQPRNPANRPDAVERVALEQLADPAYPREKVISEVAAKGDALRLLFPLYTTRGCLVCHGEPKGEQDKTGYPKEGLRLGQNAGAISITVPIRR